MTASAGNGKAEEGHSTFSRKQRLFAPRYMRNKKMLTTNEKQPISKSFTCLVWPIRTFQVPDFTQKIFFFR